jgi:stage V sporulation protein G
MEVSEVRLNLIKTDNAVRAIGSFALDGAFAVRGIRVLESKNGHNFVAFPSREKANGEYEDIAFPLSKALYAKITDAVLDEYKAEVEKQSQDQKEEQAKTEAQDKDQAQTQTEAESEAKPAPKRGRSR